MSSNLNPEMTFKHLVYLHMQQLTNFPYIEKDFDALTDYELLCLVVKYLNDVIKNSNEQNESIMNLYNAFITLQDYVNDYFDEKFPELVNNKIDELVEDGTFESMLNDALHLIRVYNTYTEMIAASSGFVPYMKIRTLGYYEINDGGGAYYYVTDTESTDEYQIEIGDYYLTLVYDNNEINIKQFGCKVDGVTDDTTALKNAISQLNNKAISNYTLIIPAITCISEELDFEVQGITLKGYNINKCGIKLIGANTFIKFGHTGENLHEMNIRDLFIQGNYTQSKLLVFDHVYNIYMNRVYMNQPATDGFLVRFETSGIIFIKECIFDSSEDAENHPATANGLFLSENTSIFDMQGCNCWNLNKLIHGEKVFLQTNIVGNWIENCKTLFYHTNATDLRYMNLNIERNHYDIHNFSSFTPGTPSIITLDETSSTNAYNSFIKLKDNVFYFWDCTALAGDSLVNITDCDNSGTIYVEYSGNTWSGKTIVQLNAYVVKLGDSHRPLVKIVRFDTNSRLESVQACDYEPAILCAIRNETSAFEQCYPNGITLCKSTTNGNGNLRYDKVSNNFVGKYNGTELIMPKRYLGETIPYPVTTSNYIEALNAICRVINNSNIGIIQS